MITTASPKSFLEPPKEDNEGGQTKDNDETDEPIQAPPAFEERRKPLKTSFWKSMLARTKTTFVNRNMSLKEKDVHLEFLKQNRDVFVWTYSEM